MRTCNEKIISDQIRDRMMDPEFLETVLDHLFGVGCWVRDKEEDCWVVPNKKYEGEGRCYFIVRRGGNWEEVIIPSADNQ